jgi:hypothetical protein
LGRELLNGRDAMSFKRAGHLDASPIIGRLPE